VFNRWSVVLASPCFSTQDAVRGGRKSEQGAGVGGRGAVVPRYCVTDESWPSSDIATGYQGRLWTERLPSRAQTGGVDRGHLQQRLDGTARKRALADECQQGGGPPITEPYQRFVVPTAVDRPDLQCYGHLVPTGRPQPSPPRPSPFIFEHTRALDSKRCAFLWAFC